MICDWCREEISQSEALDAHIKPDKMMHYNCSVQYFEETELKTKIYDAVATLMEARDDYNRIHRGSSILEKLEKDAQRHLETIDRMIEITRE